MELEKGRGKNIAERSTYLPIFIEIGIHTVKKMMYVKLPLSTISERS